MSNTLCRVLAAASIAAILAGCDPIKPSGPSEPSDAYTVAQLSNVLNIPLASSSRTVATLSNAQNRIVVLAGPPARVLVNGAAIGSDTDVQMLGGTLYVAKRLESGIRERLPCVPPVGRGHGRRAGRDIGHIGGHAALQITAVNSAQTLAQRTAERDDVGGDGFDVFLQGTRHGRYHGTPR